MAIGLSVLAVLAVLLVSEYGWRKQWLANEVGRKFVHILVGSFVAFWPFFMSWHEIRWLSVAFLVVVIASDRLKLFHAINSVQRPTYGQILFAVSVGLLTFITHSKAIYAAAILQMSLADGFAAIVGTRYGRDNKYYVFGHAKSIAGTVTFAVIALVVLTGYGVFAVAGLPVAHILVGVLVGTVAENIAALGLDNLLVPVFIGLMLAHF